MNTRDPYAWICPVALLLAMVGCGRADGPTSSRAGTTPPGDHRSDAGARGERGLDAPARDDRRDASTVIPVDPRVHAEITGPGDIESGFDPPEPPPAEVMRLVGDLDPVVVQQRIDGVLPRIRACLDRAPPAQPRNGAARVRFFVVPDGAVTGVAWDDRSGLAPEVERCIAAVLHTLRFPRAGGGGTTISYPVALSPDTP